ncbi:MAG: TonB-dependent receptor [Oceanospirillaceae bacterium]|nr:TonB-dependent receptor [Oceanospirillaceae bacterium]
MKQFSLPAALLLGSSVAVADTAATLSPVVVTATRTAQTADETLASVTVVTREDIERKQLQTVTELLRQTPGVVVSNSGGRGKASSVFLRGTNSDQVLVLIDGIKVGSATLGTTAFEHLALDQIERVEIVRGPRSSLYGSEAIGGVIQFFTRKGAEGFKPRFSVGAGSHDSREVTLGASAGSEAAWYNLSLSGFRTDGFDATVPGSFGHDSDADGYDNRSYALSGGYRFSDRARGELSWTRNEGESDYDDSIDLDGDYVSDFDDYASHADLETLSTKLELSPSDDWLLNLTLGRSLDESAIFADGHYQSHIDSERDNVSLVSEHEAGANGQISWGVDYQQDEVDSSVAYSETSRDNIGVFGLYQLFLGRHDLAFSLRHDDNEQFGNENTGSLAWGVALANDLRLTASYGTAFKAPTLNDLYWPLEGGSYVFGGTTYSYSTGGNPDLKPEESESWEIGLSGERHGIRWSANLYQTDIENLINWVDVDPSFTVDDYRPSNVDDARIRGLELIASTRIANWELVTSLDLLDPKDREDDSVLNRRARKSFNLSADRDFGRYSLGGALNAVGKRPDGDEWLGGYTTLDMHAAYRLNPDWALKGRIDNLLDKSYQTVANFRQDGRTYWLALHYAP